MPVCEETIDATLESNGLLRLMQPPQVPPGPVRVTIRLVPINGVGNGIADLINEIDAGQRLRGFEGRTTTKLQAEEAQYHTEDDERDREQETARSG
jgi:hypothetical protein